MYLDSLLLLSGRSSIRENRIRFDVIVALGDAHKRIAGANILLVEEVF
jgi:hypothetical protein